MNSDRRSFLKKVGGAALLGAIAPSAAFPFWRPASPSAVVRPKGAVFFDPGFPAGELDLSKEFLQSSLEDVDFRLLTADELAAALNGTEFDLFVNPYGSKFPKGASGAIMAFLQKGGNWVNIGGVPLSVPVEKTASGWREEIRQTSYHKALGITQAFTVVTKQLRCQQAGESSDSIAKGCKPDEAYEMYVRLATVNDFPEESGTSAKRDAVLKPLVLAKDEQGTAMAAPVVRFDRIEGPFAGGRWVFAAMKGGLSTDAVKEMIREASAGATELHVAPGDACYYDGEVPSFSVELKTPRGMADPKSVECELEIRREDGRRVELMRVKLAGGSALRTGRITMRSANGHPLQAGLHRVDATVRLRSRQVRSATGFWVYNEKLMSSGKPFTSDADMLRRDGEPYPVTGTTYMASDVHRKFLLDPNPFVWDSDFRAMKAAGVNMVRTGIWTGWKLYMVEPGIMNESALRALDAFIHTAKKYDIPVIFTFFAFLPETWGGENAYLDPRSVSAQKEFVLSVISRYRNVPDLTWDLINEPSFCNPAHLWECRPNYDRFESKAWEEWLSRKYAGDGTVGWKSKAQEAYRMTADEAPGLPKLEDFADAAIFNGAHPIRIIDYRLFAQEMFDKWAGDMASFIRENGGAGQLVTVGQDEGGTGESPSPFLFAGSVDFTSIHNWWLNDDLVWDQVMTKTPGKPNLIEETGIMFYEKPDGFPWRTEEEARNLLERKLAISFGAGGAGYVEWVWNSNPYMTSDNEAAIGFLRGDGTAKPELEPFVRLSRFFQANRKYMTGKEKEPVVLVIPHSQQFSTRNLSADATKAAVRLLHRDCRVRADAVSEYRLDALKGSQKLIIMPAPGFFSAAAWNVLIEQVNDGATLALSGPFDEDERRVPAGRMSALGISGTTRPVMQEEFVAIGDRVIDAGFRGDKLQRVVTSSVEPQAVRVIEHGKGRIVWSPVPLELSDNDKAIVEFYRIALDRSGVEPGYTLGGDDQGVLILRSVFEKAISYVLVSESGRPASVSLKDRLTGTDHVIEVPAQRTAALFIDRTSGSVISSLSTSDVH